MIGQAGERSPLSVSDVLQLGSVVIGRRVEVCAQFVQIVA